MPSRQPLFKVKRLALLLALTPAAATAVDFTDLGWRSRAEIEALPEAARPKLDATCPGGFIRFGTDLSPIPEGEVHGYADEVHAEQDGSSVLRGHVTFRQGQQQVDGETAEVYRDQNRASFTGSLRITEPGIAISGEKAHIDLITKETRIENTRYVASDAHAYGRAGQIWRSPDGLTIIRNGEYSTCAPTDRDWYLSAGKLKLNPASGRGEVMNALLYVQDIPALYVPYLNFPIDDRRQTGILVPDFGSSNDGGFEFALPVYLNLAPNYDATLTPRMITRRGTMASGEFRYLQPWGSGEIMGSYLPNDELADETRKSGAWKHRGSFAERWSARSDVNYVSDNNYFRDLGTSLAMSSTTHQERMGEISYAGRDLSWLTRVQSYQTIDPLITDVNRPYAKLPQTTLSGLWLSADHHWESSFSAEYVNFRREVNDGSGDDVDGQRFHAEPQLRYRAQEPWGYVTPALKIRQLSYALDNRTTGETSTPSLTIPTLSVDSGLIFERQTGSRLLQTLEPRLFYLAAPHEDQSELPNFDTTNNTFSYAQLFRDTRFSGGDRLDDANQMSVGLTSRFLRADDGSEKLRVSVGEAFYFRDRKVTLDNAEARSSSSGLAAEVAAELNSDWSISADGLWSPSGRKTRQTSLALHWLPDRQRLANLGYRYRRADPVLGQTGIQQANFSTVLPVGDRWQFIGLWQYDLDGQQTQEAIGGIQYESCCWKLRLMDRLYLNDSETSSGERYKRAMFIQIELKGLGGFGDQISSLLSTNIFGFSQLADSERP